MTRDPIPAAPLGLRELNVEGRRRRILDAARRLIAEGGAPAVSMRKLAREAGLSVNTLYNLIGARGQILRALVLDAIDRMDEVLDREAPLDDPIERCRAIVKVCARHIVGEEATFRPMLIAAQQAQLDGGPSANEIAQRAAGMQALAIQAAIDRGILEDLLDPLQLGRQIYHGFEFASIQWAFGQIDARAFETRALYGLEVALLAVAGGELRPTIEAELCLLEKRLRSESQPRRRRALAKKR